MKRTISLLIVPVAALTLTACGGGDDERPGHRMNGHSMGGNSAPVKAGHNAEDVMFAEMMIPHHRQAIVMARQAASRASSPDVKRLAARIERAQNPEIQSMAEWLRNWGVRMPSPGSMHMGEGMMSDADMRKLGTLSGTRFDRMFLQMMIKHHQGAVTMAETERAKGADTGAKALAGSIVTSQTAEIGEMRKLLKTM